MLSCSWNKAATKAAMRAVGKNTITYAQAPVG